MSPQSPAVWRRKASCTATVLRCWAALEVRTTRPSGNFGGEVLVISGLLSVGGRTLRPAPGLGLGGLPGFLGLGRLRCLGDGQGHAGGKPAFQRLHLLRRPAMLCGIGESPVELLNQRRLLVVCSRSSPRFAKGVAGNGQQLLAGNAGEIAVFARTPVTGHVAFG